MRTLLRGSYMFVCVAALALPFVAFVVVAHRPARIEMLLANRWVAITYGIYAVASLAFAALGLLRISGRAIPALAFVAPALAPAVVGIVAMRKFTAGAVTTLEDVDRVFASELLAAAQHESGMAIAAGFLATALLLLLAGTAAALTLFADAHAWATPDRGQPTNAAMAIAFVMLVFCFGAHRAFLVPVAVPTVIAFWIATLAGTAGTRLAGERRAAAGTGVLLGFTAGTVAAGALFTGLAFGFLFGLAGNVSARARDVAILDAVFIVVVFALPITSTLRATKEKWFHPEAFLTGMLGLLVSAVAVTATLRFAAATQKLRPSSNRFAGLELPAAKNTAPASSEHPALVLPRGGALTCDLGTAKAQPRPFDDGCLADIERVAKKTMTLRRDRGERAFDVLFAADGHAPFSAWSSAVRGLPARGVHAIGVVTAHPAQRTDVPVVWMQLDEPSVPREETLLVLIDGAKARIGALPKPQRVAEIPLGSSTEEVTTRNDVLSRQPSFRRVLIAPRPEDDLVAILAVSSLFPRRPILTADRTTFEPAFQIAPPAPEPAAAPTAAAHDRPVSILIGKVNSNPAIADAERVIHGRRKRLGTCYRSGLDEDPAMAGRIVLRLHVDTNGAVTNVELLTNTGLSATTARCVAAVYRTVSFTAPESDATVTIPATFALPP